MTRTVLRTTIRKKLGETTAIFWADSDLNQWIEDAQLDIGWKCRCNRTRGTFTTASATSRYSLSGKFPSFLCITDGGVWIYNSSTTKWTKLTYKTQDQLVAIYPDYPNTAATTPTHYMEDSDEDVIELYPTPIAACVGADYCRVWYVAKPTAIINDASEPDLPTILHPAVIDYVVATGLETRGYQDIAETHWTKYNDKLKTYTTVKNTKEDAIPKFNYGGPQQ
jgi:hypothetical protein